jgi:hypothetical protein
MSGRRINSISIITSPPPSLPGFGRRLDWVHVTTRPAVIRRDLLFAEDNSVDTGRVAESIRRLRHRPYLSDAAIEGYSCGDSSAVDLAVRTRDRWTTKPSLTVQGTSSLAGIAEDDLFGTGNSGSLSFARREGRTGASVGYESPWFLGQSLSTKMRGALYPDGNEYRARFRNQEHSVYDPWHAELLVSGYVRETKNTPDGQFQSFKRHTGLAVFGWRIAATPAHADNFLIGADAEHAALNAPDRALVVGPHLVEREYYGLKIGLQRRAAAFDTLTWLVEKQILVDVPVGFEWDALAGFGHERITRGPAIFLNGWTGRMWERGLETLSQLDLWGSGYRAARRQNWDDASVRGAFSTYDNTPAGVRSLHLVAEKLVNPDPDVRALSNLDISAYAVQDAYRLAEEAYAAELGQSVHLRNLTKSFALDGGFFTAGSLRRKSPFSQSDHVTVVTVGTGLRLVPTIPGSGTVRFDVLVPVIHSKGAFRHPVFAVSLSPWLEASRHREDPRLHQ